MNKSVLVIDTPKSCKECSMRLSGALNEWCWVLKHGLDDIESKPEWCPLKPLPEKKECDMWRGLSRDIEALGYNKCLDEILGETE